MGWWEAYDGTVIGDDLADIVGGDLELVVDKLVAAYPTITEAQVLHTLVFSSSYFERFDNGKKIADNDKKLVVMTVRQKKEWQEQHSNPPDMTKKVAPNTALMNVRNPFTGDID